MSRTHRDNGADSGWDKHRQKYTTRQVRLSEREFCTRAKIDDDAPLSYDIAKKEPMWGGSYWSGYWRPIRRWLNSHVGEPWNQVHSQLVAKLKVVSTTDDREIKNIIRNSVDIYPDPSCHKYSYFSWDFYVDDNGVLQRRKTRPKKEKLPKFNTKELTNWLGGKIIGLVDGKPYWFVPVIKSKKHRGSDHEKWKYQWRTGYHYNYGYSSLEYLYLTKEDILDKEGNVIGIKDIWKRPFGYNMVARKDRKLSSGELAYWNKIPKHLKDKVLKWSPTNKDPINYPDW